MGIDPYLIAPTLIAVIGQRLVKQLCPGAGEPFPVTDSIKEMFDSHFADLPESAKKKIPAFETLYHAKPLPDCPTGVRGRLGIFEIMRMDHEMERVILTSPVEEDVYAVARKKGMFTLQEDAILKALAGVIPFEEVSALGGSLSGGIEEEDVPIVPEPPQPIE
jgi:type II secretory ATPase GspE/PulE/Tfp pilus assembly ATPase PilB-like protein